MTAVKKLDAHGRSPEQIERDEWYSKMFSQRGNALGQLDPARFAFARPQHFVEVVKKNAEGEAVTTKIPMAPIGYDRLAVEKTLTAMASKGAEPAAITDALFEEGIKRFVVISGESAVGNKSQFHLAPNTSGTMLLDRMFAKPLLGTIMTLDKSGAATLGAMGGGAKEYREWLPAMRAVSNAGNHWCLDFPCDEVAFMADDTEKMLDHLKDQVKNLPGVEVYMTQPRYLRYYSDGSMGTQKSGAYGIRNAPYGNGSHLRPLLYDAPAWVVGIKMGDALLPGRVFVTPEGKFICSDWCQREVDKGGGIDLHTGENTKHNLMTWCAGPGISRFGDKKLAESHGEVRRARLKPRKSRGLSNPAVQTLLKAAIQLRKMQDLEPMPSLTELEKASLATVRFIKGHGSHVGQVGFTVTLPMKGSWKTAAVGVMFMTNAEGKVSISAPHVDIMKGYTAAAMWQNNATYANAYKLPDTKTRKAVYTALSELAKMPTPGEEDENEGDDDE